MKLKMVNIQFPGIILKKYGESMNKRLFQRDSLILGSLIQIIEEQSHLTLVMWVLDCATKFLDLFEAMYPEDNRPRLAYEAAIKWSRGEIKMPQAKKAALDSHFCAKQITSNLEASSIAHAMGHVVGTIHVKTHAVQFVLYGLTAIQHHSNAASDDTEVESMIDWLTERLLFWKVESLQSKGPWAAFLLKEEPHI